MLLPYTAHLGKKKIVLASGSSISLTSPHFITDASMNQGNESNSDSLLLCRLSPQEICLGRSSTYYKLPVPTLQCPVTWIETLIISMQRDCPFPSFLVLSLKTWTSLCSLSPQHTYQRLPRSKHCQCTMTSRAYARPSKFDSSFAVLFCVLTLLFSTFSIANRKKSLQT